VMERTNGDQRFGKRGNRSRHADETISDAT
jgi:hypothetical protein